MDVPDITLKVGDINAKDFKAFEDKF